MVVSVDGMCCWSDTLKSTNCLTAKLNKCLGYLSFKNTVSSRSQSLMIFFKCFKENGPGYVANLFKSRVTPYNLRSNGLNVVQTSYNSRFLHGSYAYMISHIWNQLPSAVKNAPNASSFRRLLTKLNFNGCQCSNCL